MKSEIKQKILFEASQMAHKLSFKKQVISGLRLVAGSIVLMGSALIGSNITKDEHSASQNKLLNEKINQIESRQAMIKATLDHSINSNLPPHNH